MRRLILLAPALWLCVAAGCSSTVAKPTLMPNGTVEYQQHVAEKFNPYPDNSLGPPVVGGQPRGFDAPREPLPLRPADSPPRYAPSAYDKSSTSPAPYAPANMLPGTAW